MLNTYTLEVDPLATTSVVVARAGGADLENRCFGAFIAEGQSYDPAGEIRSLAADCVCSFHPQACHAQLGSPGE
jgi:hypothetical protein